MRELNALECLHVIAIPKLDPESDSAMTINDSNEGYEDDRVSYRYITDLANAAGHLPPPAIQFLIAMKFIRYSRNGC